MIGCAITNGGSRPLLDSTIIDIPETAAGTSAAVVDLSPVIRSGRPVPSS